MPAATAPKPLPSINAVARKNKDGSTESVRPTEFQCGKSVRGIVLKWFPVAEPFVLKNATHLLHVENPGGMAAGLATFFKSSDEWFSKKLHNQRAGAHRHMISFTEVMRQRQNRYFENSKTLRFIIIFISLLITISAFEVIIRLIRPDMSLNYNWAFHPVLGWSQVPDSVYHIVFSGRTIQVEFNSKGFRDKEHTEKKTPDIKRIVVLGDSFSEAAQVNLNETYFHLLQNKLNKGANKWEIINLGVGDFGTTQEWIALNEYGWNYSPDLILHQIFPFNDICNNQIELYELCKSDNDIFRPYFKESNQGLQLTSKQPVRNFLRRHFISYCLMEISLFRFLDTNPVENENRRRLRLQEEGFRKLDPLYYIFASEQDQIPQISKGWKLTEKILKQIISECRNRNVPYLGMIIPFEGSIQPETWEAITQKLTPPRLIRDYPDRRLQKFFNEMQVPSVVLIDTFEGHSPESVYAPGHLSVYGHLLTAEAIYKTLHAK